MPIINTEDYQQSKGLEFTDFHNFTTNFKKFRGSLLNKDSEDIKGVEASAAKKLLKFFVTRDASKGNGFEHLEDVFEVFTGSKPGGDMGEFIDFLYDKAKENSHDLSNSKLSFKSLLETSFSKFAFNEQGVQVKFKKQKTLSSFVALFESTALPYYTYLLGLDGFKTPCTHAQVGVVEAAYNKLAKNPFLKAYVEAKTSDKLIVLSPAAYVESGVLDISFKGIIDKVVINKSKKSVVGVNFKTVYDQDEFTDLFYQKGYFIEHALNTLALYDIKKSMGFEDYKVQNFTTIAVPLIGSEGPLAFSTDPQFSLAVLDGFSNKHLTYKGLVKVVEDINWHQDKNIWDYKKENFDNKAHIKIEL